MLPGNNLCLLILNLTNKLSENGVSVDCDSIPKEDENEESEEFEDNDAVNQSDDDNHSQLLKGSASDNSNVQVNFRKFISSERTFI